MTTIPFACEATGIGRTKLYEEMAGGRVRTTNVGKRRLVLVPSLLRLVEPQDPQPMPGTPEATRPAMIQTHETPAVGAVRGSEIADRHPLAADQREEQRMPLGSPGQGPPHRLPRQAHSRGHSDMRQLTDRLAGSRKARGLNKHSHRRGERPTTTVA